VSEGPLERGALYVVATPIGNLGDLSPRALAVLRAVDWIAAEDTRHSGGLLTRFAIEVPLISAHAHNERGRAEDLVARLLSGSTGALIVDAGSPGISDPGARIVARVAAAGLPVRAVPGPSAVVAALSLSGFPADAFTFGGFLPPKDAARDTRLKALLARGETVVVYEAPHRIRAALEALARLAPGRPLAACRELTKLHEETLRGDAAAVLAQLTAERERGEWVIVLAGPGKDEVGPADADAANANDVAAGAGGADIDDPRMRFIASQVASGATPEEARRRAEFVLGPARRRHGKERA